MFIVKKKYYFIIENIRDINLKNIKNSSKFCIIYRPKVKIKNIDELMRFRNNCKRRNIDFYVSNNIKLSNLLKSDGIYISAHNTNLKIANLRHSNFKIIGSAHNIKEIKIKKLQGCSSIVFSRLFKTSYKYKKGFLGVLKFNLFKLSRKEDLIPLGGIKSSNFNKLNTVKCESIAIFSEIKKRPATFSKLCY